ncbi:MAG TPA: hypothetical protein PK725_08540 [Rhodocyclaceae bacterium]|nr:hypothetical protein [Rhodocyclaceae bacterium]
MNHTMTAVNDGTHPNGGDSDRQVSNFEFWRNNNESALKLIDERTQERVARDVSAEFAQTISLARYFRIVDIATESVEGMFTEEEVIRLLDGCASTILTDELREHVANTYYAELNEPDLQTEAGRLCKKLAGLTLIQSLGLIETIECAWRSGSVVEYGLSRLCKKAEPTS